MSISGFSWASSDRGCSPCVSWCSGGAASGSDESVVPIGFWYLSLGGGVLLLFYAIHRRDPVFTLGQATGVVVYLRNLQLIHRTPQSA